MLTANLDGVKNFEEFYQSIRSQQEKAHGHDYCNHHDAIVKYLKPGQHYKELGTHQGATAAAALRAGAAKATLVDWDMQKFDSNRKLFENYCLEKNIELVVIKNDSHSLATVSECDVLLIDTMHKYHHLQQELKLHAHMVNHFIVLHDTKSAPDLHRAAEEYCVTSNWKIVERNTNNVGYTVMGKS